jgi:cyanophycin synthetase
MEFRKVLALRGPNIWARFPVLEAWVDLEELKDSPSNTLPGFNERLMSWLPGMIEHRCGLGYRGGFFERLRGGTFQGHILEHVTLELQDLIGTPAGFGKARETAEEGVYKVIIEYEDETVGRACLDSAFAICQAAVYDRPFDVPAEIRRLRELAARVLPKPGTRAIIAAASARGIPARRLDGDLIVLGHGARQRRILASETDRTSVVAGAIVKDRVLTRSLLQAVGVPVPEGRVVDDPSGAWEAAEELGLPVVVKPTAGAPGRGAALGLSTRDQVTAAAEATVGEGQGVLVERTVPGAHHRLLVVDGRLVAAARREPAQVVGDGQTDVAGLVAKVNADPNRGDGLMTPLKAVELDPALLAGQGYTPGSVPPAGAWVVLGRSIEFADGGFAVDVTATVHPEVAALAEDAARVVGLDVAGVEVVADDLSRPLEEQGGAVVAVKAGPGLQPHLPPSGPPRPVGEAIVGALFPEGRNGRIPTVGVTGVNGKTTVTRLIARIVRGTGRTVGMTCTDGIYINDRLLVAGDCSGPRSARDVLINPRVEAAVFETARGGILREGLGYDRADVSVITNVGEGDHLGLGDVMTLERLAYVKSTLIDVVPRDGTAVLNAADPLVAEMAKSCRGSVFFFARDGGHPVIVAHRASGGRAAFVRDNAVVLAAGDRERVLTGLAGVPLTHGGRIGFQVENVLAAAAAAEALGVPDEATCAALESFDSDMDQTPGRFNVVEVNGATVILDFGHNPSAVAALVEAVERFPNRTRTVVFSADGDRPDESIIRQAALLGDAFDRVMLYEEPYRARGRSDGEIFALLRKGLASGSRVKEVTEVRGELAALEAALRDLKPGDLVLIQIDNVEAALERSRELLAPAPA